MCERAQLEMFDWLINPAISCGQSGIKLSHLVYHHQICYKIREYLQYVLFGGIFLFFRKWLIFFTLVFFNLFLFCFDLILTKECTLTYLLAIWVRRHKNSGTISKHCWHSGCFPSLFSRHCCNRSDGVVQTDARSLVAILAVHTDSYIP